MRLIAFIEYAAVILGVVAMIAGQLFALPKGFLLGLSLVGAGIALGGVEAIATRRMCFRAAEDAYEAYAGVPAMIVGTMALLAGTALVASAYLLAEGQWHATLSYLTRRPAPALVAAGLLLAGAGALMMLNPQGRTGVAWTLLVHLPMSLVGFVLVAGGLAAIGLGVWESLDPLAFDGFVARLPRKLDWPL